MTRISNCVECAASIESDGSRGPVPTRCQRCKRELRREQNAKRTTSFVGRLPELD